MSSTIILILHWFYTFNVIGHIGSIDFQTPFGTCPNEILFKVLTNEQLQII